MERIQISIKFTLYVWSFIANGYTNVWRNLFTLRTIYRQYMGLKINEQEIKITLLYWN